MIKYKSILTVLLLFGTVCCLCPSLAAAEGSEIDPDKKIQKAAERYYKRVHDLEADLEADLKKAKSALVKVIQREIDAALKDDNKHEVLRLKTKLVALRGREDVPGSLFGDLEKKDKQ